MTTAWSKKRYLESMLCKFVSNSPFENQLHGYFSAVIEIVEKSRVLTQHLHSFYTNVGLKPDLVRHFCHGTKVTVQLISIWGIAVNWSFHDTAD